MCLGTRYDVYADYSVFQVEWGVILDRVSLGIILPGNPECVQEKRRWLSVLAMVSKYAWIVNLLVLIIKLVCGADVGLVDVLFAVFATFLLFIISMVWEGEGTLFGYPIERCRCPYCRHFSRMRQISDKKFIGSRTREISRDAYDHHSGMVFNLSGDSAFYSGMSSRKEYGEEITKEYTYNRRCNCCGAVMKVKASNTSRQF